MKEICSEAEMKAFGASLISVCDQGGVITLDGNLGTGKTTLVRGALESLGITSGVRSPTYTLIETYPRDPLAIAHFDLYRLADPEELEYLGYRDYLNADTVCFIEWPQRAEGYLSEVGLNIHIEYAGNCRHLSFTGGNEWGDQVITRLNLE